MFFGDLLDEPVDIVKRLEAMEDEAQRELDTLVEEVRKAAAEEKMAIAPPIRPAVCASVQDERHRSEGRLPRHLACGLPRLYGLTLNVYAHTLSARLLVTGPLSPQPRQDRDTTKGRP